MRLGVVCFKLEEVITATGLSGSSEMLSQQVVLLVIWIKSCVCAKAPRHEDRWCSGSNAPIIINHSTRWRSASR